MKNITIDIPKMEYQMEEAYKALRTNLQFCGEDIKVVDITSCTPNEGKSTVVRLLARSLAEAGKNVVLLDADMRKSVLIGKMGAHETNLQGLSHFLSGQASLNDVLCETNIPGMYVIFSGSVPPNPAELLGGKRFRALLDSLKQSFDYVIVDTPPLGSVIDSAVVANECDGSILVLEYGVISYQLAQDVVEQLKKADCPILGTVLNKVDMKKSRYYGKYYGRYYGKEYGASEDKR